MNNLKELKSSLYSNLIRFNTARRDLYEKPLKIRMSLQKQYKEAETTLVMDMEKIFTDITTIKFSEKVKILLSKQLLRISFARLADIPYFAIYLEADFSPFYKQTFFSVKAVPKVLPDEERFVWEITVENTLLDSKKHLIIEDTEKFIRYMRNTIKHAFGTYKYSLINWNAMKTFLKIMGR